MPPLRPALACLPLVALLVANDAPRRWTGPGFEPLTRERVAALPAAEQPAWTAYLEVSARLAAADAAFLAEDLRGLGLDRPLPAPERRGGELPLDRPAAWYGTAEARALADRIVSYQTPAGGWSKSLDYRQPRPPGGDFGPEPLYRGTFDNDATVPELRFLARVASAAGNDEGRAYREAFLRGLGYVFAAQYPNGGWPQIFPLASGYHDSVTFNDGVMTHLLSLLREVATGAAPYAFVPAALRADAAGRLQRGIACVLAAQVEAGGRLTAWGQQHDALTLAPCAARNFEPVSLSADESAGLVRFLLTLDSPSPAVVAAIEGAAAWFERTTIRDAAWTDPDGRGRRLVPAPGAPPLWARLYEIGTDKPVFGDRDRSIRYAVEEISAERRDNYAWYVTSPAGVLRQYAAWRKRHAQESP